MLRASAAYSKRSHGRFASMRSTNGTTPSGSSITGFSSGGASNAWTRKSSLEFPLKGALPANKR
jgi:hypothetical protein